MDFTFYDACIDNRTKIKNEDLVAEIKMVALKIRIAENRFNYAETDADIDWWILELANLEAKRKLLIDLAKKQHAICAAVFYFEN